MSPEDAEWSSFLETAFVSVLETADEGIFIFDRDGRCRMIGRRAGELFGIEPAAHVGKPRTEVLQVLAQACEEPDVFLETVGSNDLHEPPKIAAEIDVRRPRPRTLSWTTIPIVREGTALGRLGLVRDITRERSAERSLKQLHARIQELTPVDALTGLLNLRRFREELEREHGRSSRAWDSYAVLRLDVDGMGEINEEYGTPVGDQLLEQIADKLKACRREYDVIARYDADEFCVLLPGADAIAAQAVADRMNNAVFEQAFEGVGTRRVTLSTGACIWVPPSGEGGEDILKRAGIATMRARAHGTGKIEVDANVRTGSNPGPTT